MTRYRAYQAHLAGHALGEVFGRAFAFLKQVAANDPPSQLQASMPRRSGLSSPSGL